MQVFRPFPAKELVGAVKNLRALAVLDRAEGLSTQGGPLFADIRATLYQSEKRLPVVNYIYGLGGRDINVDQIKNVFGDLQKIAEAGKIENLINYIGVRG
jgi:pyruvate ferredoxin oxidoreductase alpha subunit